MQYVRQEARPLRALLTQEPAEPAAADAAGTKEGGGKVSPPPLAAPVLRLADSGLRVERAPGVGIYYSELLTGALMISRLNWMAHSLGKGERERALAVFLLRRATSWPC